MTTLPSPGDEIESILAAILSTGGASRSIRRRLQDLLSEMPADAREAFLAHAFESANARLKDDSLRVLQGMRKLVTAIREVDSGRGAAAGISEAHFSPGDVVRNRIMSLAEGAKRTLDVCMFTITDNVISEALSAAHERGVRVRIITDDLKRHEPGSDIDNLLSAGLPLVTDHSLAHMHHKFCVVDRIILVAGSYNWTLSAARSNLDDIIVTNDRLLVDGYVARFEELWHRFGGTQEQ